MLAQMETNYTDDLVDKLASLQEKFEHLGGYDMQAKAEKMLEGMGFITKDLDRPMHSFSGGERMRVLFAQLLLQRPDLLMLDEPTNHLDLPAIQWVENYLQSYSNAIIVVSHDQSFLDNVTNKTVEVMEKKLHSYAGNYTFYKKEKTLREAIQENVYSNQQKKIKHAEQFIERFRSKASKARQVQSRVKSLEKMNKVDSIATRMATVQFNFSFRQQPGKLVVELTGLHKAFGILDILKQANAKVERGDKIALIGANGMGKSTLLKIMADHAKVDQGEVMFGHQVDRAFYAQHQLEALNLNNNLFEELSQTGAKKTETDLRKTLGMFLFTKDDVFKKIKVLSGGEKARVALAKTLISEANFLLLDEPTNHLDMVSISILAQALQQYQGTFVVVSHDRHFISQVANTIWYIEDQQIKVYPGTYEEYAYARKSATNT